MLYTPPLTPALAAPRCRPGRVPHDRDA